MTAKRGSSRVFVVLLGAMLAVECAPLPSIPPRSLSGYLTSSRDGLLRYRVPMGWFDVSADSQASGHVAWLVCSDLGATIAVDEVYIDGGTRSRLDEGFLKEIARLLRTLRAGREGLVDLSSSERTLSNGKEVYISLLGRPSTGEKQRLVVIDTGQRLYIVTLVMTGREASGREEVLSRAQDLFAQSLQW